MKQKILPLPLKAPNAALRIAMRDGVATYICANGVPEQDATALVEWAKNLAEVWEDQQHTCDNCRKGTNYGTDGVYCNKPAIKDNLYRLMDPSEDFGQNCPDFDPWPDDDEADASTDTINE